MATITRETGGYFGGRALLQQTGSQGGARHVFAKIDDIKNDLVFPTFGGQLINPFPGPAKIYAGDLLYFNPNDEKFNGPTVTLLKTYKVAKASTTSDSYIVIEKGFRHKPFVGDHIGKDAMDTNWESPAHGIVTKVEDHGDVWHVYFDNVFATAVGEVLIETDVNGNQIVKNVNSVAAWDYDLMYSEAGTSIQAGDGTHTNIARYFLTPSLRGTMIIDRMSPLPKSISVYNISNIHGWFRVDALNRPVVTAINATDPNN